MIKDIRQQIKWAYQRVVRGYDDRATWDFDYALYQLIPALKKICTDELGKEYIDLNPEKKEIFKHTLHLIDKAEKDDGIISGTSDSEKELWVYVANNIDCYWT